MIATARVPSMRRIQPVVKLCGVAHFDVRQSATAQFGNLDREIVARVIRFFRVVVRFNKAHLVGKKDVQVDMAGRAGTARPQPVESLNLRIRFQ